MLKKETIEKIETLLKIKGLAEAITAADEKDITIPELSTFTETELKTLRDNEYGNGKKAGVEMGVDELKKELSLDFQGKTIKGLVEAASKKAIDDAKLSPDVKVKELTDKLATVQATAKDYETRLAAKEQEVEQIKQITEIHKDIPEFGDNAPALAKDDVINLMKANGYEFKADGVYKDGKQVQDNLAQALPRKDVISGFLKEKKLITEVNVPDGRGGGNNTPPAKAMKLSELKDQYKAKGISLIGEEFNKAVEQAIADNKDFDLKG